MSYIGEIRLFAGNFAPAGWAFCDGQLLSIAQYDTLFSLIGTRYGGNGASTFALPDLRGRVPVHQGNGVVMAEAGGVEEVTLTTAQIPAHSHALLASAGPATHADPANRVLGESAAINLYLVDTPNVSLGAGSLAPGGGSQPHLNLQPFLCVHYIIALFGIYPSAT